ncbi:hypothetical protein [Tenacibaculum retecalamus]|uniref:hypothetical protein n=1 Tax=Tenacibaculum retecalamus TaxID=3018315 RepID=UPI0023D9343D|nr:hypothetical protein [Tenacibaculum retecalamus]WBX71646.1 hypothetical protein PG912_02330 [Tenacibaculum retecalamus]
MIGAKVLNSVVLPEVKGVFSVRINDIALDEKALIKIEILHNKIKTSNEYKQKNSIDLGRYISLLIGSPEHYYAITNVPEKLDTLLSNYKLNISKGYINNSRVSLEDRIIEYSNQEETKQLFLSTEFDSKNNTIVEYETIEIMENGQLKFGIFDVNKNRINSANSKHTNAGKPAKCMWCHESNINKLFSPQNDFPGFLTYQQLNDTLIKFNNSLKLKQNSLTEGVVYSNSKDHVMFELGYITFMEPSALRLSNEWNILESEVKNLLTSLPTHKHEEYPFLGILYNRKDVEQFAPYKSLETSMSIREVSEVEVNYIEQ